MLYHFLYPLRDFFFGFNVFKYISFRAVGAAITALIISFLLGPWIIRTLQKLQIGEVIRPTGPESHLAKQGTPTMGGIIVLTAIILPTLLWSRLDDQYILLILLATAWMGAIGFLDDYLKVIKKYPKGLVAKYKLAGQVILGLIIGFTLYFYPNIPELKSIISIPFVANGTLDIGFLYIPLVVIVITGASNAVNLTDGLDGLATGLSAIAVLTFGAIAYATGRFDFSDYLNIVYLPGTGELFIFALATVGACIGFLWYNSYPAKIFMGDTGSLALGAALGTLAVLLKKEVLLVLIGGVFVMESISVIMQVSYFKYTKRKTGEGKRLFKMAPIHHHFELKGWHENTVVVRFWIIGILLALLSLTTIKVQ
ncbi:MAG: phospho-N-acetylmuramoyl-pentapeptide-transferase [Candidatus Marinimicrobia bacterium]|nr:phospho-N-acetylmuramoyl-pentapeptide-transferase [Candidatus Neomarinimicrobiota bacterium]MBT3634166.1 phospho-N-acetylmuramoyl-pentapeptide-transferase [Candidatus Neomarinimicrobiota bacterium]MBT3683203.1 phospho-N-acetylmuramoyl-pentapeptide-transferase [Candidatus Neomarinimicrobiota bacterium]MBT3759749.1 phospho-N-acetylmuramoyl-pentapeptide-transferase [Candidatus Neomarinimicrobiota bacterium]MBT3895845.1 phospho-N-acetylmuramoyl-pentapeptide-transferase [Candidatus Neomarinimicro